jgi:hypothetical protein
VGVNYFVQEFKCSEVAGALDKLSGSGLKSLQGSNAVKNSIVEENK